MFCEFFCRSNVPPMHIQCCMQCTVTLIVIYTLKQNKLCIIETGISLGLGAIPAWNFLEIFSTPVQMMSISENDCGHCTLFVILNFYCHSHEVLWPESFCLQRVSLYSETTEKHIFPSLGTVRDLHQHTASISWRLSSGRWGVRAWHFAHQSCNSFWFSQGYCPEPAET